MGRCADALFQRERGTPVFIWPQYRERAIASKAN